MKSVLLKPAALALALGIALAGPASAQTKPTPAQQKELDAARAEVERAAQHFAELSAKYGEANAPIRIQRRLLRKPVIGVVLAPDDDAGVRIAGVTPDSAAAAAGLKSGDRIVSIDGKQIDAASSNVRVDQARELLASMDAKTPVKLAYLRDGINRTVALTPKVADRLMFFSGADDGSDGNVRVFDAGEGKVEFIVDGPARKAGSSQMDPREMDSIERRAGTEAGQRAQWSVAIAPDVRSEVIRLGGDCKGDDCKLPVLAEAFRWNGLNLATVDARLGRYFGTTDGVLVLSTGKDLEGLQPGDVIRRIGGKAVNSPREAMDMLRAQPASAKVRVDYLRDRTPGTAQVTVPKALPFRIPPPPPAPPAPPRPPMPPMAPAAPGAPQMVEKRKVVMVDDKGVVHQWEGDGSDAPPAWVGKLAPKAGKGGQQRRIEIIDKDGKRTEWEDDGTAPLPPGLHDGHAKARTMVFVDADGKRTVIEDSDLTPPPPAPPKPPKAPPPPPPPPIVQ